MYMNIGVYMYTYMDICSTCIIPCMNTRTRAPPCAHAASWRMAARTNAHAHNAFHLRLRVRASATASPHPHSAMLTPLARVRHTSHRNSGNA